MPDAGAHRELGPQSASLVQPALVQRPGFTPLHAQMPLAQSLSLVQPAWQVASEKPPSPSQYP